ncbi:helix-turn-helix domain-containing protein [Bosea sp. PAMC 26642]|uniref:helix-turn-helix domain-containing protein n=1 Tax=Bosea sp. (strain PAMC 26642) TaxID=1792307 RepID=UPI001F219BAD|nr:helix-turn-helix transcriptional regulator [Bosea sp. PAMC 26642]
MFADIGLPDAADRQTKTRLAMILNGILQDRKLKQAEAARLLDVPQPKISALVNYRLDGFSVEKLMAYLTSLDQDVEIRIQPSHAKTGSGRISVLAGS